MHEFKYRFCFIATVTVHAVEHVKVKFTNSAGSLRGSDSLVDESLRLIPMDYLHATCGSFNKSDSLLDTSLRLMQKDYVNATYSGSIGESYSLFEH